MESVISFPHVVLDNILWQLPTWRDRASIERVCKHWFFVARSLWRRRFHAINNQTIGFEPDELMAVIDQIIVPSRVIDVSCLSKLILIGKEEDYRHWPEVNYYELDRLIGKMPVLEVLVCYRIAFSGLVVDDDCLKKCELPSFGSGLASNYLHTLVLDVIAVANKSNRRWAICRFGSLSKFSCVRNLFVKHTYFANEQFGALMTRTRAHLETLCCDALQLYRALSGLVRHYGLGGFYCEWLGSLQTYVVSLEYVQEWFFGEFFQSLPALQHLSLYGLYDESVGESENMLVRLGKKKQMRQLASLKFFHSGDPISFAGWKKLFRKRNAECPPLALEYYFFEDPDDKAEPMKMTKELQLLFDSANVSYVFEAKAVLEPEPIPGLW